MRETLERLWNEYLSEECALITSDEERRLAKKAIELYEKVRVMLNEKQVIAIEKYIDALLNSQSLFVKKAFFKGCEFTASFLIEVGNVSTLR